MILTGRQGGRQRAGRERIARGFLGRAEAKDGASQRAIGSRKQDNSSRRRLEVVGGEPRLGRGRQLRQAGFLIPLAHDVDR